MIFTEIASKLITTKPQVALNWMKRYFVVKHPPGIFLYVQCVSLWPLCFSMNDNESAAEMLIETLGPAIVNATDSQSRWEQCFLMDQMWSSTAVCCCVCPAGLRSTPQRTLITWSVCSCCWVTTLRSTPSTCWEKQHSWWPLRTDKLTPSVRKDAALSTYSRSRFLPYKMLTGIRQQNNYKVTNAWN